MGDAAGGVFPTWEKEPSLCASLAASAAMGLAAGLGFGGCECAARNLLDPASVWGETAVLLLGLAIVIPLSIAFYGIVLHLLCPVLLRDEHMAAGGAHPAAGATAIHREEERRRKRQQSPSLKHRQSSQL